MTPRIDSTNVVELPTSPHAAAQYAVRLVRKAVQHLRDAHPDLAIYAVELEACADQLAEDFVVGPLSGGTVA